MNPSDPQGDLLQPLKASSSTATPELSRNLEALWTHIYRLQTVLAAALVALVILSLGIIIFMGRQMTAMGARLAADRQSAQQMYNDFQVNTSPKMRSFVRSLESFAATNQDFAPILEKYRPVLGPYFAPPPIPPPAPSATPRPSPSPAPAKK
jgi:hypothetical protein